MENKLVLGFELVGEATAGIRAVEAGLPQWESPAVVINKNVEILVVARNRNQQPAQQPAAVQPPAQVTP